MRRTTNIRKPISLRQGTALAAGMSAVFLTQPALAQDAGDEEIMLDTLEIKDHTADSNPYTQEGAPYKARISGDIRRPKPLAETPATITVLTERQIEESGANDMREILSAQPGVTVGTGENGNAFGDRFIIRGHEARSDVFVDGLRDPGMTTRESFVVDQIEITKGPSSSFAGRGATGGAVNSITKQASTDYMFTRIDGGIGTDDYYRATLDTNIPLTDTLAVRVNGLYSYEEIPNRNFSDRDRWGAAVSGAWTPSETVLVLLDYYHLTANDIPDLGGYVPAPTGTAGNVTVYGPWDDVPNYAQEGDFLDTEVDTFTGRIFITPWDGFTITNATRYGETTNGYVLTGLRGGAYDPEAGTYDPLRLSTHQGNQEVEYFTNQFNVLAEFDTGSIGHALIVGSEYSNLQVTNGTYAIDENGPTNCTYEGRGGSINQGYCITDENRNVNVGNIHDLAQRDISFGRIDSDWQVETLSFYAMDTVDLNAWLSVHGGVRLDAFSYSNDVLGRGADEPTHFSYSDTLWNGHAGIGIKPAEELYLYFNWGTAKNINGGESDLGGNCGYGGICVADGTDIGDGRPEGSESFEAGIKADLFDDRFMATAAVFQITKDDVFESAGDGYSEGGSLNTGKNRVRGVEFGIVGNLTSKLSGQAALTLMDSEILDSNDPAKIGRRLSNFANTQFSGQVRYQATDAFAFGGTATYKSAMFTGQPDDAASYNDELEVYTYRVPSYWVFDAFASYQFTPNIGARVNVTNVGDTDYYQAGYRSGHFLYKGDERRSTLTVTAKF
ncbi:TonB-dependent receptor [Croceicoccus naphthovorans]|uniref:Uncharacterized protein n=1 Tax=Croceicoccus naphthovorans TaxID=1348774 RepID=A0A0G3XEF0_9SPHN|nr:TonB-dependent receptor [Croceicoccus naphthovorans]AKM08994.1 hypothetical protein AB433_01830 [Croceicoccus naphthovorans]MBB3989193.1 catecholate siderophore receptor [Croceicoccus naphthovorans]